MWGSPCVWGGWTHSVGAAAYGGVDFLDILRACRQGVFFSVADSPREFETGAVVKLFAPWVILVMDA